MNSPAPKNIIKTENLGEYKIEIHLNSEKVNIRVTKITVN